MLDTEQVVANGHPSPVSLFNRKWDENEWSEVIRLLVSGGLLNWKDLGSAVMQSQIAPADL